MKTIKKEKGQILIILALALVAMLAVTALAVDGSMIYNERRKDQSAADSVALAAASEAAKSTTCAAARTAAISKAISYGTAQAGVTLANDAFSPSRVEATCSGDNTTLDIRVVVTSDTPTTFAQMISSNQLTTTVETVTRVTFGSGTFAGGSGLVTLGTTCDANGGIYALGNGRIYIKDGGAFSSSCLKVTGSSQILSASDPIYYTGKGTTQFMVGSLREYTGTNGIIFDGTAPVFIMIDSDLTPPSVLQYNANTNTPHASLPQELWPIPTSTAMPPLDIPVMTPITPPTCGAATSASPNGAGATIYPGTYASLSWGSWGSGNLVFSPGVYCFTNSLSFSGGGGTATVVMNNVTLYFTSSATANFATSGNLRFSFDNGVFYKTSGSFTTGHTFTANNSKFYLGSGNFTLDGSAVMTMNNSSIYLNNGSFRAIAGGRLTATNFTTYIKQGGFTIEGGAKMDITAPNCATSACGVGPAIQGVLLYMDKTNTGALTVANGTDSAYKLNGTIFAPNALATFSGGTKTNAINVQLIVKRLEAREGAIINMDTTNAVLYSGGGSTTIELRK